MPDGRRPQQREWQGSKRRAPGSLSLAADCVLREVNVCVCVCVGGIFLVQVINMLPFRNTGFMEELFLYDCSLVSLQD